VRVANSGHRALKAALSPPKPDLILLDVMMPEMDGYQVLDAIRALPETSDIPVIFVTAMGADEDEERGLRLGAVDYVTKPIRPAILLARVKAHLELKQMRDWLTDQNGFLESEVVRRMRENELIKDVSLNALALLAEKRDNETGNHLHRTQSYVELLMSHLVTHPRFMNELDLKQQELIAKAAPLHDIGKVGIPDAILLKPGKLTAEEFEIMKTHASIGGEAIIDAIRRVTGTSDINSTTDPQGALAFLEVARQIAVGHHEKWDGSGYPRGIAGEAIPVAARLMALADVFDALMSKRHYKAAFALDDVVEIIVQGRDRHFDPDIVDAFLLLKDKFVDIARRYADVPH
jgi:putative two-component system response regulator